MGIEHTTERTSPVLTRQQVNSFKDNGFLAVEQLVDNATVGKIRAAYDEFLTGDLGGGDNRRLGGVVRQIMFPHQHHAYFADNPALRAGFAIARQLIGKELVFHYDMLMSKGPGETNPTLWHQDHSYSELPFTPAGTNPPNEWVQFWLALDDVDEETGCMTFIPGSHSAPLRQHYVAAGDAEGENRMLATQDVDDSRAVRCPLPAGGCTVHLDGTLHYTDGNHSKNRSRRAYIFSFRPKDASWLK